MDVWKQISSIPVISDRWLKVTADRCQLPNGVFIEPYYVIHESDWVHVFALDTTNALVVVNQYRYAGNAVCCELPGGVIDAGEEPLEAAKRELAEETGFIAKRWVKVGTMFANPARQTNRIHIFIARDLTSGEQKLDATEQVDYKVVKICDVTAAIEAGSFSQALHIASFYCCVEHLKRGGEA